MTYRILVFGASYNPGGIENFLINYTKRFDSRFKVDFVNQDVVPLAYEKEIKEKGGDIVPLVLPARKYHPIQYNKKLRTFFKHHAHQYDCMWFNYIDLTNIDEIKMAHKFNVKKIIIHAHNSKIDERKSIKKCLKNIEHYFGKREIANNATTFWACSYEAAKWFFPSEIQNKVKIIKNAIELQKYSFSEKKRVQIRKKYQLNNNFVIGNVGRLSYQKNQIFLINLTNRMIRDGYKVKLLLVGDGQDKTKLNNLVNKLEIKDHIIFTGVKDDIQGFLSSFDLFVFPSHFEGLGMAAIEAEANGVPVIASKFVIPSEIEINNNLKFLELNKEPNYWARFIENNMNEIIRIPQKDLKNNFKNSGYDISQAYIDLEKEFLEND